MAREEIIEKHKEKYPVWLGSDGRWKTRVPDKSHKYGKLVAKKEEGDLLDAIVYQYEDVLATNTLEKMFPEWISYKALETTPANAHKISWAWERYYEGDPISKRKVSDLKTIEIKKWFITKIEEFGMTKRQYKDMKTVLNGLLDYAIELELIRTNPARNVRNIGSKHFAIEQRKTASQQVYMVDEHRTLENLCEEMFTHTNNSAYLAVAMNFYLGLRVGELVALKEKDFGDLFVHIEREEVKAYQEQKDGKFTRNGYEVAPYTKTPDSVRDIPLTSKAREYVSRIKEWKRENGFDSEYLLVNKFNGRRMHNDGINNVLRRMNRMLDTSQKGNHSIRKTYLSTLDAFSDLSDEEIRTVAGHKYISTTQNSYLFSTRRPEKRIISFEKALGSSLDKGNCAEAKRGS